MLTGYQVTGHLLYELTLNAEAILSATKKLALTMWKMKKTVYLQHQFKNFNIKITASLRPPI
jgi:hypothetical protein